MAREPETERDLSLHQTRFEYAWRWFEIHARQRVTMFNFFLLSTGILANAYGILFREELYWQAAIVAVIGAFAGLVSYFLDVRNSQLVNMGEKGLKRVEKEHLELFSVEGQSRTELAILSTERQPVFWQQHKWLIRSLEVVAVIGYSGAATHSVFAAMRC